jgi:hypothetical protein
MTVVTSIGCTRFSEEGGLIRPGEKVRRAEVSDVRDRTCFFRGPIVTSHLYYHKQHRPELVSRVVVIGSEISHYSTEVRKRG